MPFGGYMEGMKGDHKKIHGRKYGCFITGDGFYGGFLCKKYSAMEGCMLEQ